MSQIKTMEDLQVNILDYFTDDLNTYIGNVNAAALAADPADKYQIDTVSTYSLRESAISRQQVKRTFTLQRDDVIIDDNGNTNYIAGQTTNFGCYVMFYDDGTDLTYRKGLRYEESVYQAIQGLAYKELADIRIIGRQNAPFSFTQSGKKTPQGLIASGIVLNVKIGG